jgi:hypothetical protein
MQSIVATNLTFAQRIAEDRIGKSPIASFTPGVVAVIAACREPRLRQRAASAFNAVFAPIYFVAWTRQP